MMLVVMPAAAQPAAGADLSLIEPFLGACRRADLSVTMHDTHCFDAVDDGPHVRDRHELSENGKTVYPGETIYSAGERSMIFTCVNSLGGVGRGSAEPELGGLKSAVSMRASPRAKPQALAVEWRSSAPPTKLVRRVVLAEERLSENPGGYSLSPTSS